MKPTDLRGILQYIPQFREKTFVLAIDGAIVTDENFANNSPENQASQHIALLGLNATGAGEIRRDNSPV